MEKVVGVLRKKNIETLGSTKISIEQMEGICSSCAKIMKAKGLTSIDVLDAVSDWNTEKMAGVGGDYPGAMPRQLSAGLCKKFGGDPGFFTKCEGSDLRLPPGWDLKAYCAELHKYCVGKWPGEKGKHTAKKQVHWKFVHRK